MLLQKPQLARGRLGIGLAGGRPGGGGAGRSLRIGPEAALHQQALAQDVPGWAEEGMPVLGGRQSLLQEGGNGGIRVGPASEEMGVERFEEGGNGGIRSGPGSEEEMGGGESWPMRFVRGGTGEVGGHPAFPIGKGIPGGAVPLEEEEVLGGSEGWRMSGAVEGGINDRGAVQMGGTGGGQNAEGGMESGVGLPNWGDYGKGNEVNYQYDY